MTFFIFPILTPTPRTRLGKDHFSESEIERFKKYGFEKKVKQARKIKIFGVMFWFLTIVLISVLIRKYR